jgi:TolB protein
MTDRQRVDAHSPAAFQSEVLGVDTPLGRGQARRLVRQRLEQLTGGRLLSDTAIIRLTHRLVERRYDAGEIIVHEGVRGDFMGLVTQGQVAVLPPLEESLTRSAARRSPTVLLLPGSTFGEAMLVDGRPSGSTLQATTDTEVLVLRRADLVDVAGQRWSRPVVQLGGHWGWLALALLFVIASGVLGVYLGIEFLSGRRQAGNPAAAPPIPGQVSDAVHIVAPLRGEILRRSVSSPVRALLTEPGFSHAELQIDGRGQAVQVNLHPEVVPWEVEWAWDQVGEGTHSLVVQAYGSKGEWRASVPVTVTVVATGTLAFVSNRDGASAIYMMDTDGRNVRRLVTGPGEARRPSWGTDGTLAFVAETEPGSPVIRRLAKDGSRVEDLVAGWDPAWSPDGTHLAYGASVENVNQVFVASMPDAAPAQVTVEEAYAGQPTWAPDGRRLAYVAERDGNWDIWVTGLDGSEPRRLTDDPAMDWAPDWSPVGSRLAFVSNRGGTYQIYVMRPDGSDVQPLTDLPQGAESPAWSPDGSWLAFVTYTGDGEGVNAREVYLMRADGRDLVRLTYNAFDDTQPDWGQAP